MLRLRPSAVDRLQLQETFTRDLVAVARTRTASRPSIAALLQLLSEP